MDPATRQWATLFVMVFIALEVIVADVLLARYLGVDATFSRVVAHAFDRWPVLMAVTLFGLGVLAGHVLLPVYAR
jgi:hypothetical protein